MAHGYKASQTKASCDALSSRASFHRQVTQSAILQRGYAVESVGPSPLLSKHSFLIRPVSLLRHSIASTNIQAVPLNALDNFQSPESPGTQR